MRRLAGSIVALSLVLLVPLTAAAENGGVDVSVTIPSTSAAPQGPRAVDDSILSWAINPESGSGAFFGGCNFLSAGKAGDSGTSRLWLESDGFYRPTEGNVTIEKPGRGTEWLTTSWNDKCLDARGSVPRTVTTGAADYGTGNRIVMKGGTGTVDPSAGTATLRWSGSFTVVFYGGLTYWHASDPVLTVAGGKATLRAQVGGYGASMEDTSKWLQLKERTVTLATFDADPSGELGLSGIPAYHGVKADQAVAPDQVQAGSNWGAFPNDFLAFQGDVGQAGYWYSTGGMRDFAKPPYPVNVSWSAAQRIDDDPPVDPPRGDGEPGATQTPGSTTTPAPATSPADPSGRTARPGSATTRPATAPTATSAPVLPQAPAAGADGFPATTPDALQAGARGLIPAAVAALEDPRALFVTLSSALVALAATAFVGFRRRWLVLPWSKNRDRS